jgi:hypothetical protein
MAVTLFNKTSALFVPAGVKDGPITWRKATRPRIQMAMVLGAGTMGEVALRGHDKRKM